MYLLGATLFEVLAGRPPHGGETIMEVLHAVLTVTPSLPDHVPPELAELCQRAMARDPAERFDSVEAVRRALHDFEQHRESARIAQRASERLCELEARLRREGAVGRAARGLFGQARFGFEQALDSWPDNESAREGLARAFEVMVELELRNDDPQVAAALAREAPSLPDELRRRLDEAVTRRRAGLEELASHRRDLDTRIGQRTRAFVSLLMGLLWTVAPAYEYWGHVPRWYVDSVLMQALVPAISMLALGGLTLWARESLTRTRVNRTVLAALFLALGSHLALLGGFFLLGLPLLLHLVGMLLIWAVITALVTLTVDRRLAPIPIAYFTGFLVAALRPEDVLLVVAICDLVFTVVVSVIWMPERLRGPIPEPDHRA